MCIPTRSRVEGYTPLHGQSKMCSGIVVNPGLHWLQLSIMLWLPGSLNISPARLSCDHDIVIESKTNSSLHSLIWFMYKYQNTCTKTLQFIPMQKLIFRLSYILFATYPWNKLRFQFLKVLCMGKKHCSHRVGRNVHLVALCTPSNKLTKMYGTVDSVQCMTEYSVQVSFSLP